MSAAARPARIPARDPAGAPLDIERLVATAREASRVIVDVGAGDGRYAYRLARREPESVVLAVDPAPGAMRTAAARAARSTRRGGAPNVFFYVAPLEHLDGRLDGLADVVTVTLPWAGLLRGVLRPERAALARLRRLLKRDGALALLLNADAATLTRCGLPASIDIDALAAAYAESGLGGLHAVGNPALRSLGTVWEGRLARRSGRPLLALEARALPSLKRAMGSAESGSEAPSPGSKQAPLSGMPEEPQ